MKKEITKEKVNGWEIKQANEFRIDDGSYVFPFDVLDKTPGGFNLGRIEWHLEPFYGRKKKGKYYIEKIYVWATQTRDDRYYRIIFEIPCFSDSITADSLRRRSSYFHYVWRMNFCEIHKMPVFSAYPADEHSRLELDVSSSISCGIDFV